MNPADVKDLTAEQRELLELLLQQEGIDAAEAPILRRDPARPAPLSFTQQRVWFLRQMLKDSPFDNLPMAFRVRGRLQPEAVARSVREIMRRHDVLRMSCRMENGQLLQRLHDPAEFELQISDLRALPREGRPIEASREAREIVQRQMPLNEELPIRAALWRLNEEEWQLLFVLHQFVSDGWSARLFLREFSAIYPAYLRGESSPLNDPPIQYADYAAWQRGWLESKAIEQQLGYWKKQLQDAPSRLNLPVRSHAKLTSMAGATHSFKLGRELSDQLRELGRGEGATLFATLLTGFKTLLQRYADEPDVVVGTAISSRNRPDIEQLLGSFSNYLLLRTQCGGDPTFRQLIERVRGVVMDAFEHQDLPLEKLAEATQNEPGRYPLLQVFFVLRDDTPQENLKIAGLECSDVAVPLGTATLDLSLDMTDTAGGLSGTFTYKTDLFDAQTIARMAEDFSKVLAWAVSDPDQRISSLPVARPERPSTPEPAANGTASKLMAENWSESKLIEQALLTHDSIEAAKVTTHPDHLGEPKLTAYVVYAEDQELTATEVRRFLRQLHPELTPPAFVVEVEELPETAIPQRSATPLNGAADATRPEPSAIEKRIAAIWREALGIEHVDSHDSFFELGGHSFLAMRVLAQIQSETGCHIEPQAIVRDTLAQIAARVEEHLRQAEHGEGH
jgi:acyl carrier protein